MKNQKVKEIITEAEKELAENACFHELDTLNDAEIIFAYEHYWDSYPEYAELIEKEAQNLLGLESSLRKAGFSGFLWVGDYVKNINI